MIARISPSSNQLAAACFPVPGCTVGGYASRSGYKLFISPPQPWAGPTVYCGHGATCYEALAAAVQLFHDTAHAYPDAQPLAAASSYCPPQEPPVNVLTCARFVADPNDPLPAPGWEHRTRTAQELLPRLAELLNIEWNRVGPWLHGWDDAAFAARTDVEDAMDALKISACPPQEPQGFPADDEPAHDWPQTIRTEQSTAHFMQRLGSITGRPSAAEAAAAARGDEEEAEDERWKWVEPWPKEREDEPKRVSSPRSECEVCNGYGWSFKNEDYCQHCEREY